MTRAFRLLYVPVVAGLIAGASPGCSPLGPSTVEEFRPNGTVTVENFSGSLAVKGIAFYSFTIVEGGTTFLSLVSLKQAGVDVDVLVTLGLGVPRGTTCVSSNYLSVKANGSLQLTGTTDRGVHCAVIFDPGNLTAPATFSLNIVRPK